jgi:hypothetical protein
VGDCASNCREGGSGRLPVATQLTEPEAETEPEADSECRQARHARHAWAVDSVLVSSRGF